MTYSINLNYSQNKKNLYFTHKGKKVYVYLKINKNGKYIVPIDKKFNLIKIKGYDKDIKINDKIFDNIIEKTLSLPLLIEKDSVFYLNKKPQKSLKHGLNELKKQAGGSKLSKKVGGSSSSGSSGFSGFSGSLGSSASASSASSGSSDGSSGSSASSGSSYASSPDDFSNDSLDADLSNTTDETSTTETTVKYIIYTEPKILDNFKIGDNKEIIEKIFRKSVFELIKRNNKGNLGEYIEESVKVSINDIKVIKSEPVGGKRKIKQKGGSSSSDSVKEDKIIRKGPQVGSQMFTILITGPSNLVNETIFTEKSEMSANFPNVGSIKFFVLYDRKSNLQKLFTSWDNSNTEAGKVVDRYVGKETGSRRKKRFSRSVNYLKNITERLRDCTDISVAYKEKHREVENMIVTIRKLYSLIIFLRDQIARNQDNYDTLERLILEIMIAMKGDYHIPEEELSRLKAIQKRIADDGVELEKKFRIVSNQILDRLKSADALRNESPEEIGPDFPLNQEGLKFNEDEDKDVIKPANYIVENDPNNDDKILKYFKKNDTGKSTGAPFKPDPSPFKYTEANKEEGYYGQYVGTTDPDNNLDNLNEGESNNPDIEKNRKYNNMFTEYAEELKKLLKEYNEEKRREILEQIKKQFNDELPPYFLNSLKIKSDKDADKLLSGKDIERKDQESKDNKVMINSMGEEKINITLPNLEEEGQFGGGKMRYRKPKKSRKKDKVSYKNKLNKYRSKLRTMNNKYKVAKKLMNKCMNI